MSKNNKFTYKRIYTIHLYINHSIKPVLYSSFTANERNESRSKVGLFESSEKVYTKVFRIKYSRENSSIENCV